MFWSFYSASGLLVVFAPYWNLPRILYILTENTTLRWIAKFLHNHVENYVQACFLLVPLLLYSFVLEIPAIFKRAKATKALRHLGLKSSMGAEPKVIGVHELSPTKTRIVVQSVGIDIASFQSKKGTLESSLDKIVQEIRQSPTSKQIVEIIASSKELPKMVRFDSVSEKLVSPYTFLVGEANSGFMVGDLRELHHMLIAGSTGGGKSVFFKQALIGILKSSKYIQLYLIDLKRGVEMKLFETLPNVIVAKEVVDAVACLRCIVAEMERRFKYLEQNGFTEIDPARDNLDRLIVGVDEASVLFTVERGTSTNKKTAQDARELTDKLTKLGRAAGIHVILATQKVTKETIDTRVQTNVHAKLCFRVNTLSGSMTVLGNKKANDLPEIKGRGIWSVGSNDIEVQVPYLSHEEAKEQIENIAAEFRTGERKTQQKLLSIEEVDKDKTQESTESYSDIKKVK